ncbi:methylmalonyl-CoA mutase family protein [Raineya sp.]|jgi:methylmalonyl-CoA mutase
MLFSEFQSVSPQEWLLQIEKDLKGKPLEEILAKNYEGIPLKPFYTQEDVNVQFSKALAQSLLRDKTFTLPAGATGKVAEHIGDWLSSGRNWDETAFENFLESVLQDDYITIHTAFLHNAGANAIQEIATTLAIVNVYLQKLQSKNFDLENFFKKLQIVVAVGSNFFMEVAKLQVIPFLVNRLLVQYLGKESETYPRLLAVNAFINKSARDAYNNIIRSTLEVMAARLAGADEVSAIPYDYFLGGAENRESEYIATCIDRILHYESKIDFVKNATQGTYFVEYLAYELAQRSWNLLQEIEKQGGLVAYESKGLLSQQIQAVAKQKIVDFQQKKSVLIGVNKYPNPKDEHLKTEHKDLDSFFQGRAIREFRLEEFL